MPFSALQCRLECEPGYIAQRTPLVTCVDGEYEKGVIIFTQLNERSVIVGKKMVEEYFEFLDLIGNQGIGILHADSTFSPRWNATIEMERTDCRGDLSFMTNIFQALKIW